MNQLAGLSRGYSLHTLQHHQLGHGTPERVRFGGKSLFKRYGIDPKQVKVNSRFAISEVQKREILQKMLEAHEHALKSKAIGNFSDFYPTYHIQMNNGKWVLATTIENGRETTICAERATIISGVNQALAAFSLSELSRPGGRAKAREAMQVKLMIASSHLPPGEGNAGCPCADCSQWLASQTFVPKDAMFAFLSKPKPGEYVLNVLSMQEMYPQKGKQKASFTEVPLEQLGTFRFSRKGRKVMAKLKKDYPPVTETKLLELLQAAKAAYGTNRTAHCSGKKTGAAVLLDNGKIIPGGRFDVTKRWIIPADLLALVKGAQESEEGVQPMVIAVAYFSHDEEIPSMESLGRLAQTTWGDPDVLVVTLQNNRPMVRTIEDYMTRPYVSRLTSAAKK